MEEFDSEEPVMRRRTLYS